jgi:hypothetical protein
MKNPKKKTALFPALLVAVSLFALSGCGYVSYFQRGMWQEFPGIFTAVEPADLDLYRRLLPQQFEMPARPAVALFLTNYVKVVPFPMSPYLEAAVALRCKFKGEEGWHVLTMPVTRKVPMWGGHYYGFPKYIADEITLKQTGNGWTGSVQSRGEVRIALEFTPGGVRELKPYEREFMEGKTPHFGEPIFQLVPYNQGPTVKRVLMKEVIPAEWKAEPGMVKITISPRDPWSGLIPRDTLAPGLFQVFKGGNILAGKKVK